MNGKLDIDNIMDGEGLFDFFKRRDSNINPPKVREMLKKIGNDKINGIRVMRKPIQSYVRKAMNFLSFGKLEEQLKRMNYDELFHLGIVLITQHGDFLLDKREVLHLENFKPEKEMEYMVVSGPTQITVNELLENTQKFMGDKYGSYNPSNNNCQVFVISVLKANKMDNPDVNNFVMQDTVSLFKNLPSLLGKFSNVVSGYVAPLANKIIEGEGMIEQKRYTREARGKGIMEKHIKKELMKEENIRKNPKLTARQKLLLQLSNPE